MDRTLFILGTGVLSELHITNETAQALQSCDAAYVIHNDLALIERLRSYCKDVRTVFDLYEQPGLTRSEIYRRVAARVVSEGEQLTRVALVVFGHPMFLVSACEYTAHLGKESGFRVRVLPAVSSFDTLLCDLEEDLGYGVQIYCAENLVDHQYRIDPRVPLVLFQLTQFKERKLIHSAPDPSIFGPLVDYLLGYYPGSHACTMVHSSTHLLEPAERFQLRLDELNRREDLLLEWRPTLYIPRIAQ